MPITKRTFIDKVELLLETGDMQIREATVIEEDGVEISRTFHRRVVNADSVGASEPTVLRSVATNVRAEKARVR